MRKMRVCLLSGIILMLLGAVIMLSWVADWSILLQIIPGSAPMQFNTAMGFFILGISLYQAALGKYDSAALTSMLCGVLGFWTLLEYRGVAPTNIDEIFWSHQITDQTSDPGRMAPNTALGFCMAAVTMLSVRYHIRFWLFNSIVLALGLFSVIGYAVDLPALYSWAKGMTDMAVHTGAGFLLAGMSMFFCFLDAHNLGRKCG